jgi:hypothetical protein
VYAWGVPGGLGQFCAAALQSPFNPASPTRMENFEDISGEKISDLLAETKSGPVRSPKLMDIRNLDAKSISTEAEKNEVVVIRSEEVAAATEETEIKTDTTSPASPVAKLIADPEAKKSGYTLFTRVKAFFRL